MSGSGTRINFILLNARPNESLLRTPSSSHCSPLVREGQGDKHQHFVAQSTKIKIEHFRTPHHSSETRPPKETNPTVEATKKKNKNKKIQRPDLIVGNNSPMFMRFASHASASLYTTLSLPSNPPLSLRVVSRFLQECV